MKPITESSLHFYISSAIYPISNHTVHNDNENVHVIIQYAFDWYWPRYFMVLQNIWSNEQALFYTALYLFRYCYA